MCNITSETNMVGGNYKPYELDKNITIIHPIYDRRIWSLVYYVLAI